MLCSGNMILCRLAKSCDAGIFALAAKFYIETHDVVRSGVACIKDCFWFYFSKLVQSILCFCIILCVLQCVFYRVFYCPCCILAFKLIMIMINVFAVAQSSQCDTNRFSETGRQFVYKPGRFLRQISQKDSSKFKSFIRSLSQQKLQVSHEHLYYSFGSPYRSNNQQRHSRHCAAVKQSR